MTAKPKSITHFQLDPAHPPTLTPEEKARLEAMPIDYSDIPELPDDFWTQHPPLTRENKLPVTLRLDADVLAFFRAGGEGYQTRINAVLRAYVEAQSRNQGYVCVPIKQPVSEDLQHPIVIYTQSPESSRAPEKARPPRVKKVRKKMSYNPLDAWKKSSPKGKYK
jgi:uncharacterized protein (DUF4415 family)